MAVYDMLQSPPPARAAAVLSLPDTLSSHTVATASEALSFLHSNLMNELSSSDKENGPSHSDQKLNRSKIVTPDMSSLTAMSPTKEHMSFTPQRMRPPPRAWERRPATPFITRNEGQKIWKRIPLQELGTEINQQISRREKEEKESYIRVVKRLCLDFDESAQVHVKSDNVRPAIGTKFEEESIDKAGSPKKKMRFDSHAATHQLSSKKMDDRPVPQDQPVLQLDNTMEAVAKQHDNEQQIQLRTETIIPGHSQYDAVNSNTPIKRTAANTIQDAQNGEDTSDPSSKDAAYNTLQGVTDSNHCMPLDISAISDDSVSENEAVLLANSGINASNSEPAVKTVELLTTECFSTSAMLGNTIIEYGPVEQENVQAIHEETCGDQSPSAASGTTSTATQAPVQLPMSDNDETAFLRDFLQRAQASKAARIVLSPQKKAAPALSAIIEDECLETDAVQNGQPELIDEIEDDDLSPPIETAIAQQMFSATDAQLSSPTRRSTRTASRTVSSRLPRYQMPCTQHFGSNLSSHYTAASLPGTIQLKRAIGNEFVFNAKSQQHLAMMTRSNTKKNQGDAIHVAHRLAQLKKELEVRTQEELAALPVTALQVPLCVNETTTTDQDFKTMNKKRKREKQDDDKGSKSKRNVRWPNDEQLVKYREPSPFINSLETNIESEEKLPVLLPASDVVQQECSLEIPAYTEQDSNITTVNKLKKEEPVEESSKLKVRRIRKIKLDSVNGTPAPKTRSRSITDSNQVASDRKDETSSIHASSLSSTRRSSRMPLPVSTPIPLPSLDSAKGTKVLEEEVDKDKAKEKVRAGATVSRRTAQTCVGVSSKADTEATGVDSDRKFDGRRRLRARG